MTVLILRELRAHARVWVGFVLVTVVVSALTLSAVAQAESVAGMTASQISSVRAFTSPMLGLTVVTGVTLLSSNVSLVLATMRRTVALWQIIGVQPARVRVIIASQLMVLTSLSIALGAVVSGPLRDLVFRQILSQSHALAGVQPHQGWGISPVAVILLYGTVFLASSRGIVAVGKVPPLAALTEDESGSRRRVWGRLVASALMVVVVISTSFAMIWPRVMDPSRMVTANIGLGVLLCVMITAMLATVTTWLAPVLLRIWTAIFPGQWSSAWFLARRSCQYNLARSGATITPLVVAFSLVSGLYTVFLTSVNAQRGGAGAPEHSGTINNAAIFLILGGPLFLCAVGVAVTLFMTGRDRSREVGVLIAAGASESTLIRSGLYEAVMYTGTAVLLAVCGTVPLGLVSAASFQLVAPGARAIYGVGPTGGVVVVGGFLVAGAIFGTIFSALKSPLVDALAAT